MSLEEVKKSNGSQIVVYKQFDLLEKSKNSLSAKEHFDFLGKFGHNWMCRFNLINDSIQFIHEFK